MPKSPEQNLMSHDEAEEEGFVIKKIMEHEGVEDETEALSKLEILNQSLDKSKDSFLRFAPDDLKGKVKSLSLDDQIVTDEVMISIAEMAGYNYADKEGYKLYNNFWTYLQRAWSISSPERFIRKNQGTIDTLDKFAKRYLGDFYTGPVGIKQGTTMVDVYSYYNNMSKKAIDSGKFSEKEIEKLGHIIRDDEAMKYQQVIVDRAKDTEEICRELGFTGGAVEAYEEYAKRSLESNDDLDISIKSVKYPERATVLDVAFMSADKRKKLSELLTPIYDGLKEKGYSEHDLIG